MADWNYTNWKSSLNRHSNKVPNPVRAHNKPLYETRFSYKSATCNPGRPGRTRLDPPKCAHSWHQIWHRFLDGVFRISDIGIFGEDQPALMLKRNALVSGNATF
jgi:hypothetical protein